ncbi:unnamed protein product [Nezara viridula]|uniref:Uncharacterized protein n=1 Tax=Nezara viridula TaxID=85310 RepID=A0A9P0H7N1_NEZVI|nr:unnamed protein product [Nezara viridula]
MVDFTILLLAAFTRTSTFVGTSQVIFEPKTLVSYLCPDVTNEMLQDGLDYGAKSYRYDLITPAVTEFTSQQALLLSLLYCLATQDRESCTILADCSNRIQQVRSRHVALWLREDFSSRKMT